LTIDGTDPGPGVTTANETVTYHQCIEGNSTTDGTIKVSGTMSGNSITLSINVNLTLKTGDITLTEAGDLNTSFDAATLGQSSHVSSNQISVAISSPTINDKITLSNLDITETLSDTGDSSATESYSIETSRLGGLFSLDTDTAVATSALSLHPHAGQVTVTGAKSSRLVITVLGDETFTPPAGQGQVKLELDTADGKLAAAVYMSWTDLEAASDGGATTGL